MPEHTEGRHEQSAEAPQRFDAEAARRILHRAVDEQERLEQKRLDTERSNAYSLEELEEIATEAGISREAVRAAVKADQDQDAPEERRRGLLAWLENRLPATWSRGSKHAVLIGACVALFVLLLSLPGVGPVVFWATVLALLMLVLLLLLGVVF